MACKLIIETGICHQFLISPHLLLMIQNGAQQQSQDHQISRSLISQTRGRGRNFFYANPFNSNWGKPLQKVILNQPCIGQTSLHHHALSLLQSQGPLSFHLGIISVEGYEGIFQEMVKKGILFVCFHFFSQLSTSFPDRSQEFSVARAGFHSLTGAF